MAKIQLSKDWSLDLTIQRSKELVNEILGLSTVNVINTLKQVRTLRQKLEGKDLLSTKSEVDCGKIHSNLKLGGKVCSVARVGAHLLGLSGCVVRALPLISLAEGIARVVLDAGLYAHISLCLEAMQKRSSDSTVDRRTYQLLNNVASHYKKKIAQDLVYTAIKYFPFPLAIGFNVVCITPTIIRAMQDPVNFSYVRLATPLY